MTTTTVCADCGQPVHRTTETCDCCGQPLWAHDDLTDTWVCAGIPGARFHTTPASVTA